ncbi:MAG TPA: phytanoyl-CoA dioxygenase family protein [Bryobacteraceae bacterium]|jgi:hypothetical protein
MAIRQCLPEICRNLEAWLRQHAQRDDLDFFNPGLNDLETNQVEGRAGDVIMWSTRLPHSTARNLSKRPRVAAFVSMQPPEESAELRESIERWWLTKRAPNYWRGLPGQLDPEPGAPAVLSGLVLGLVGATPW